MSTAIAQTIMGDQNCSLVILVCAQPDLAVDAGMKVLCVDYLLVKQKQQPQSPRVFSLGFLWVTKIFCYSLSLSLSLESTPNSLFSLVTSLIQTILNSKKNFFTLPTTFCFFNQTSSTSQPLLSNNNLLLTPSQSDG